MDDTDSIYALPTYIRNFNIVVSVIVFIYTFVSIIVYLPAHIGWVGNFRYSITRIVFVTQYAAIWGSFMCSTCALIGIYTLNLTSCNVLMIAGAVCYGVCSVMLYGFLLLRSRLVQFGRTLPFVILERFLLLVMIIYMFSAPVLLIISTRGDVLYSGDEIGYMCRFHIEPYMTIIIFSVDSILSIGFLILFVVPLLSATGTHRDKAKENLLLSSVMILSTSASVLVFTLLSDPLAELGLGVAVADSGINVLCSALMTRKGWKSSVVETKNPVPSTFMAT